MDQPAGDTLSAIDRILADWSDETLRPGEFTARDAYEKMPHMTFSAIRKRLSAMVDRGKLVNRIATINGSKTRIYREPD